jgi:adenosylcobinamide-phosphate guanylyltransferase
MIAVVMCGGKGSRMADSTVIEKPLQMIREKTLIEYVVSALARCTIFDKVVIVPSRNTPMTSKFVRNIYRNFDKIEVIESLGLGYSLDTMQLVEYFKPSKLFLLGADLPFINAKIIKKIIDNCAWDAPCISVILRKRFVESIGIKPSVIICKDNIYYCHSGITIIDSLGVKDRNQRLSESYLLMDKKEIAVNVNTMKDLELAESLCHKD